MKTTSTREHGGAQRKARTDNKEDAKNAKVDAMAAEEG
jgi:hypothetical protein